MESSADNSGVDLPVPDRWNVKKVATILGLAGMLAGALGTAGGWYSGQVKAEAAAEMWQDMTDKRLNTLERAQNLDLIRGARTEYMLETILRSNGHPPPPKSEEQIRAELEVGIASAG